MYVYIRSEPGLWTVGFYDPQGNWHPESDHETIATAAARVHWLNGGNDARGDLGCNTGHVNKSKGAKHESQ